jgi:hypothetical protein
MLAREGYSLRSASGHDIERGGQFSFRVRGDAQADQGGSGSNADDDADDAAVQAAIAFLKGKGVDVEAVRVFHEDLDDRPGALKAFVDRVTKKGYPVIEISVATPNPDGTIPVQIYAGTSLPEGIG